MNPLVRVLYFAPDAGGGGAHVLRDIVSRLDRSRYAPEIVFATGPDDPRASRSKTFFEQRDIPCVFLGQPGARVYGGGTTKNRKARDIAAWLESHYLKPLANAYSSLRACYRFARNDWAKARRLAQLLEERNIDLVHINGTGGSEIAMVAARLAKVPCVAHVHMFPKITGFHRYIGQSVSCFLYISKAVKRWCESRGWSRGQLVHNGVDIERFTKTRFDGPRSNDWGSKPHEKLVAILGRIVPWKGQHVFIQAMGQVVKARPDVKSLVVGEVGSGHSDKQYAKYLHSLIKQEQLEDHVQFVDEIEDVPELLNDLDVLVHASVEPEPFGLVIIEGMATATPVVATAGGGVDDIVRPGEDGLVVVPNDAKDMARSILRILDDQALASRLSQGGRQTAQSRFTLDAQLDRVVKIYQGVLGDRSDRVDETMAVAK